MPKAKLTDKGILVDAETNEPIKIGDEDITVTNAKNEDQTNAIIQSRLNELREQNAALEKQAHRTPELETMLTQTKEQIAELEGQLQTAKDQAEAKAAQKVANITRERDSLQSALNDERTGRLNDGVRWNIRMQCGNRFRSPERDVIPQMMSTLKREPVRDSEGNVVEGKFLETFSVRVKNDKGEFEQKELPLEKALNAYASDPQNAHYLNGATRGGSHQGETTVPMDSNGNPDYSSMGSVDMITAGLQKGFLGEPTGRAAQQASGG